MHGVGHEHWENGVRTRAEWLGRSPDQRWPRRVLEGHLACFREILRQQGLGPEQGVSPPRSFVPCAFRFLWNNADPESTGAFMSRAGIRYASTPFASCCFADDVPARSDGGFEHDLLVLDRGRNGIPWNVYDTIPEAYPDNAVCGIHWPNLLRPDPAENSLSVTRWIRFLEAAGRRPGHYLARSMAETCSQWLYCRFAELRRTGSRAWVLDTRGIPEQARRLTLLMPAVLRLPGAAGGDAGIDFISGTGRLAAMWDWGGDRYFAVEAPIPGMCRIKPATGTVPSFFVRRRGTFEVLATTIDGARCTARLRVYGTQRVDFVLPAVPVRVRLVETADARIAETEWRPKERELRLRIETPDIQGTEIAVEITSRPQSKKDGE
jgi:hypothetical protein